MSNKLSNYTIYNNWEKLSEDSSLISEKNFSGLVERSVKYHSKECFDILIQHPNTREWLSKYPRKLTCIFDNYVNAPNNLNEYYLNKVLPFIAVLNFRSIEKIISNTQLFSKIFTKLKNDEKTIKHLFIQIIGTNNIETFKYIYNWVKSNPQNFPFFNNNWINSNILYCCLEQDNIEILKELEKDGLNLSIVNVGFTPVPSLIISLLNKNININRRYRSRYCKRPEKNFECFKYLLNKGITTDQNLLWSAILKIDDSSCCLVDYFHLNVNWPFDFSRYQNDDINLIQQVHNVITPENLLAELTEEPVYPDFWMWEQIIDIIYYLVKTVPLVPQIKNHITNMNTINNFDIVEKLCVNMFKSIKEIETPTKNYRWRHSSWRKRQKKIKVAYLIKTLEIIQYFKENKLTNFNPLTMIGDNVHIKKKTTLRKIIIYLMKLGYASSDDFKTNVIPKVFTKKEVKDLDKTLEKSKLDDMFKLIKKNISGNKLGNISARKSRKANVLIVPGIGGENEGFDEQLELDINESDEEIVNESDEESHFDYDTQSEASDSDSEQDSENEPNEIDV